MNYLKYYLTIVLFTLVLSLQTFAQKEKGYIENLPRYHTQWLHFGFTLGLNSATFKVTPVDNFYSLDSLFVLQAIPKIGFNLGIVTDVALGEYFSIRFIPDIAFAERIMKYHFLMPDTTINVVEKNIESTFLNFPIDIKLRSQRAHNFGMYLLGGGKYAIDLISQKNVKNLQGAEVIKLRKGDIYYQVGAGVDMYLPYFKFGIEVKLAMGLKDVLIQDNTIFSNPISKLNSKMVLFSFMFEG